MGFKYEEFMSGNDLYLISYGQGGQCFIADIKGLTHESTVKDLLELQRSYVLSVSINDGSVPQKLDLYSVSRATSFTELGMSPDREYDFREILKVSWMTTDQSFNGLRQSLEAYFKQLEK